MKKEKDQLYLINLIRFNGKIRDQNKLYGF